MFIYLIVKKQFFVEFPSLSYMYTLVKPETGNFHLRAKFNKIYAYHGYLLFVLVERLVGSSVCSTLMVLLYVWSH